MNNEVLLSVIVPIYNVEKYLDRCINSLCCQNISAMEIILVDDGSTDLSGKKCDDYEKKDSRIKVIHKQNGGLGAARNTGIDASKGRYIGFVDGDDWVVSDMYDYLLTKAQEINCDICCGQIVLTKKNEEFCRIMKKYNEKVYIGEDKLVFYLETGIKYRSSQYSVCNKVYAKELFEKVRFPEKQLFEDSATNFELFGLANKVFSSSKEVYYYYQNSQSITRNRLSAKDIVLIKVGKQIVEKSMNYSARVKELAYVIYARTYFSLLMKMYIYGVSEETVSPQKLERELLNELRQKYSMLIHSSMPVSRKIAMMIMVRHNKSFRKLIWIYIKIRRKCNE